MKTRSSNVNNSVFQKPLNFMNQGFKVILFHDFLSKICMCMFVCTHACVCMREGGREGGREGESVNERAQGGEGE